MTTAWDPLCPVRSAMFVLHASKILRAMYLQNKACGSRPNMYSRIFAAPEASPPAVNVAGLRVQPWQLLIAPLAGSFLTSVQSGLQVRSPGIGLQHWPAPNGIHVAIRPWNVETHPTVPKWIQHGSDLYESHAVVTSTRPARSATCPKLQEDLAQAPALRGGDWNSILLRQVRMSFCFTCGTTLLCPRCILVRANSAAVIASSEGATLSHAWNAVEWHKKSGEIKTCLHLDEKLQAMVLQKSK